jgi:hypothetical protein
LALVAGVLAFTATAANAASTSSPTSFHPDEDGTTVSIGNVLADRFDGTDTTAHLTAVTNTAPDRVQWRVCPAATTDGGPGGGGISAAELGACNITIGEDTEPRVPGTTGIFTSADKYWDVNYDVPAALDNQTRDILVLGCVGAGEVTDPAAGTVNCQTKLEEGVILDDANTGEPDVTTGEMVSYCTADNDALGGPGVGGTLATDPCQAEFAASSADSAAITARFKAFPHGSPVPNNGFVIRTTTSTDITTLRGARDYGPDADADPAAPDQDVACTILSTLADRINWQCVFPNDAALDDNVAQAVWIYNSAGGTATPGGADCNAGAAPADTCTLDSHGVVSQTRAATTAVKSLSPDVPTVPASAGCQPTETKVSTLNEDDLTASPNEEGCLFDQFTDPFSGPYSVESTGPGAVDFNAAPTCTTLHDHNGDGLTEHCHGTTDAAGETFWEALNPNRDVGTQTITFCSDPQNGGTNASPPANHGCADTTVKDTNTINWQAVADEVFLAFAGTATDPNDPCRTGETFKRNKVGDTETLVVCTFDRNNNPIGTDGTGANDTRLQWFITGTQGGEETAVRFSNPPPPAETAPGTGQATVDIEAFRQGSDLIEVELNNFQTGDFLDDFFVEKRVDADGGGGGGKTKTARRTSMSFRHTNNRSAASSLVVSGDVDTAGGANKQSCVKGVPVKIQRYQGGKFVTRKEVTTDNDGNWEASVNDKAGRYRAKVPKTKKGNNNQHVCQSTKLVKKHKH